jgi:hypothetical protein
MLVVFNLHHSAARIAPLTVAQGADAAIGFQDTIDDSMAEQFLADLYAAWRMADPGKVLRNQDVPLAFATAFRLLREYRRPLRGSCIVLWSAQSLFVGDNSTARELRGRAHELAKQHSPRPRDDPDSGGQSVVRRLGRQVLAETSHQFRFAAQQPADVR